MKFLCMIIHNYLDILEKFREVGCAYALIKDVKRVTCTQDFKFSKPSVIQALMFSNNDKSVWMSKLFG